VSKLSSLELKCYWFVSHKTDDEDHEDDRWVCAMNNGDYYNHSNCVFVHPEKVIVCVCLTQEKKMRKVEVQLQKVKTY